MEKKRRGGRALRAHGRHHVVEGVPFPRATSRSRVGLHLVLLVLHPVSSYTTGTEDEGRSYFSWRWPLTSRSNTCHFSTSAVQAFMSSCGITLRPNAFPVSHPTKSLYLLPPTFIDDNDSTYYWICAKIGRPAKCTVFCSQNLIRMCQHLASPLVSFKFPPWTPPLFHAHLPTLSHKQIYLRKNTYLGM